MFKGKLKENFRENSSSLFLFFIWSTKAFIPATHSPFRLLATTRRNFFASFALTSTFISNSGQQSSRIVRSGVGWCRAPSSCFLVGHEYLPTWSASLHLLNRFDVLSLLELIVRSIYLRLCSIKTKQGRLAKYDHQHPFHQMFPERGRENDNTRSRNGMRTNSRRQKQPPERVIRGGAAAALVLPRSVNATSQVVENETYTQLFVQIKRKTRATIEHQVGSWQSSCVPLNRTQTSIFLGSSHMDGVGGSLQQLIRIARLEARIHKQNWQ